MSSSILDLDPFSGADLDHFPNTRPRTSSSARDGPSSSGSIKFVHQDCLMEWLSHSQKKHCELCKTPFRFTKLYAHDMPKALPFFVFVTHMAKYLLRNLLVWLRACLVLSVWLGWLPYLMRSVWSFLFWISDEGLGGGSIFNAKPSTAAAAYRSVSLTVTPYGTTVCPSSPLFAATTTVATIGGIMDRLPRDSVDLMAGNAVNLTTGDPLYSTILRYLFGTVGLTDRLVYNTNMSSIDKITTTLNHPSLLSDVGFLRNLTRHPPINRAVIAILEGQIITILVIVCFILIILVRDYVVQQQPEINMRAAFAAAENAVPQHPGDVQVGNPPAAGHQHLDPEEAQHDHHRGRRPDHDDGNNLHHPLEDDIEPDDSVWDNRPGRPKFNRRVSDSSSNAGGSYRRSGLAPIPELRGNLGNSNTPLTGPLEISGTAVHEYLKIHAEAGGDPKTILKIIEERHLEDQLDYWFKLTKSMVDPHRQSDDDSSDFGDHSDHMDEMTDIHSSKKPSLPRPRAPRRGEFDQQPKDQAWPDEGKTVGDSGDRKGKGKLVAYDEQNDEQDEVVDEYRLALMRSPLRPRANTDGPKVNDTINPLGNNNWSFVDLLSDPSPFSTDSVPPPIPAPRFRGSLRTTIDQSQLQDIEQLIDAHVSSNPDEGEPSDIVLDTPAASGTEDTDDEVPPRAQSPDRDLITERQPERQLERQDLQGLEALPPHQPTNVPQPRPEPAGLVGRVADFMWRDVDAIDPAELAAVIVLDEFGDLDDVILLDDDADDAIDDAEDLEGILELLGMRGAVAGLFQNAIFCAFLVSITIFIGIFIPYNFGRFTVWIVANPMRPVLMFLSFCKFIQDCALVLIGANSYFISTIMHKLSVVINHDPITNYTQIYVNTSRSVLLSASGRITRGFMTELYMISASEVRTFSVASHEALLVVKTDIGLALTAIGRAIMFLFGGGYHAKGSETVSLLSNVSTVAWETMGDMRAAVSNTSFWVINLNLPETSGTIDPELAYWNGIDRFWAIIGGYVTISTAAGLYLHRGRPFSSGQTGQQWEASIIDGLNQASGVMKVILIIGIEMLVFPLYCGMLLDVALMPLFEATSMKSRMLFTVNYPLTSIFVHWFVGTGYMFHFALFVSMCRKIMRKGVLYFIRDPDDPEFHPVRDVLERNLAIQLRKILFSAFVYGALVLVCLGGVVWGLSLSLPNVLPIHYSSNEPVLEFPIDLLFYNFLMPLAVKFFRPSDGLHVMYTWWFRKCARALRITWFLFGERRVDEEGHLALRGDSGHRDTQRWRTFFLELEKNGEVVPKTWRDVFEGGTAKPTSAISKDDMTALDEMKASLVMSGQLIPDGRFVRTPASDAVKIPKGKMVFLEVAEDNTRQDGQMDLPETDLYSSSQYQLVYVPPHFRFRVFLFILFIWIFAAVTGVGITIVPLVFGRRMFKLLIPHHILTNDIYAFSIGIYILGSAAYLLFKLRSIYSTAQAWIALVARSAYNRGAVQRVLGITLRVARVSYAYFFLLLVFPLLVASLMELYALIPLHEFMYSVLLVGAKGTSTPSTPVVLDVNPQHTIRVIQAWTIGLLYLKLSARLVTGWFGGTRLAFAVRAVLRRGWLDPDLTILTRAFIIPGLALWAFAIAAPLLVARFTIANGLAEAVIEASGAVLVDGVPDRSLYDAYLVLIYRLSFPFVAFGAGAVVALWSVIGIFRGWKVRIRDEAYLIGERLHNFGVVNVPPRTRTAWKAGGPRL
ncbi:hypothetical protein B0T17DRAFT_530300 [Bombardia bombarda]|uniref:RING-type E3 ubiquitin transferase n=1 Tax=Bombardia bombarda TaxID=252184 RepID=A0AA39XCJ9_9PEZI|nr:hypothetical protein B0T17DRAFT_530300 [Bombardia bombarda]